MVNRLVSETLLSFLQMQEVSSPYRIGIACEDLWLLEVKIEALTPCPIGLDMGLLIHLHLELLKFN